MEKKTINKTDEYFLLPSNLSINKEQSLETIHKNNSLQIKKDSIEDQNNNSIKTIDIFNINDWNNNEELFLKDSLFENKTLPHIKTDETKKENKILKFNNNLNSTLLRKIKTLIFNSLLKYDNYIISQVYNNNIGNGINIKKLLKISHFQIKNLNANFNKKLLNTTQGEIFSSNISTRHTSFPLDHNKRLINKLLNEKNEEKRKLFNQLFNITLLECIHYLKGEIECSVLKGFEKYYEIDLDKDIKEKKELKNLIINYERIITDKKPRKNYKKFKSLKPKSS